MLVRLALLASLLVVSPFAMAQNQGAEIDQIIVDLQNEVAALQSTVGALNGDLLAAETAIAVLQDETALLRQDLTAVGTGGPDIYMPLHMLAEIRWQPNPKDDAYTATVGAATVLDPLENDEGYQDLLYIEACTCPDSPCEVNDGDPAADPPTRDTVTFTAAIAGEEICEIEVAHLPWQQNTMASDMVVTVNP